jgi:uncharacterized RDD family membrane protein YckC
MGPHKEVIYPGFLIRLVASVIDGILFLIVAFVLGLIIGIFFDPEDIVYIVTGYAVPVIMLWLYYAIMESSPRQATLGKMALGIIVTDNKGNRISFGRATGRYFAKIISTLILLIGFIMIAFTKRKQGLHDMIAETLVVAQ